VTQATLTNQNPLRTADLSRAEPSHVISPPPARFTPAAKAEWEGASEVLRAEVLRLEAELTAGLKKHQAAAARDAEIADFHDRAAKAGATLKDVLSRYIGLEDLLRTDPDAGLAAVFRNSGISPQDWAAKQIGKEQLSTAEEVERFAAAHPGFEDLSEDICFFIESGRADDLAEAYELAVRFNLSEAEAEQVDGGELAD
jgi:hypothetical protein